MSESNTCFLKQNNGIRPQPPFKCQEQSVQDGHLNQDTWLSLQLGLGTPEDGRSETVQKRSKLGLWEEKGCKCGVQAPKIQEGKGVPFPGQRWRGPCTWHGERAWLGSPSGEGIPDSQPGNSTEQGGAGGEKTSYLNNKVMG